MTMIGQRRAGHLERMQQDAFVLFGRDGSSNVPKHVCREGQAKVQCGPQIQARQDLPAKGAVIPRQPQQLYGALPHLLEHVAAPAHVHSMHGAA